MPFYDRKCTQCSTQLIDVFEPIQPPDVACPACGAATERAWLTKANAAVDDSIPGGELIYHGICNEDGTPRRYYSKSEMAAEAKRRGLVNIVYHVPGSPHTVDWRAGMDAQTLANAAVLLTRGRGANESDKSPQRRAIEKVAAQVLRDYDAF